MRKLKKPAFLLVLFVLIMVVFANLYGEVIKAEFKPPKDIAKYIPPGFTIDEQYSGTKDYGMIVATNVLARKDNTLPYPFTSPKTADFALGYVKYSDRSMLAKAWQEAQQYAEKTSQSGTNPRYEFVGKENIRGGGVFYWYRGTEIKAQHDDKGGYVLHFYKVEVIKQINNNSILKVKIEDFVGEQDTIRNWFQ